MTVFKGMLLFDVAEPKIGRWRNELGWRGTREVWRLTDSKGKDTPWFIAIDPHEEGEEEDSSEVWIGNDSTGFWDSLGFGSFEECNKIAKDYMRKNLLDSGYKQKAKGK